MKNLSVILPILVWFSLMAVGLFVFSLNGLGFRRRWFGPLSGLMSGLAVVVCAWTGLGGKHPWLTLPIVVPIAVLMAYLGVRGTAVCAACGGIVDRYQRNWMYCPECGSKLGDPRTLGGLAYSRRCRACRARRPRAWLRPRPAFCPKCGSTLGEKPKANDLFD